MVFPRLILAGLVALVCSASATGISRAAIILDNLEVDVSIYLGTAEPPFGNSFPERPLLVSSHALSAEVVASIKSDPAFPADPAFDALLDALPAQSSLSLLLNQGIIATDPQADLEAAYAVYVSDLEAFSGQQFSVNFKPGVFLGQVIIPVSGTELDPTGETIIFSGNVIVGVFEGPATISAVPEPSSLLLWTLGAAAVFGCARRRRFELSQ